MKRLCYILGLIFLILFLLSTLSSTHPLYALLSLLFFIISGKQDKDNI